MTWNELKDLPKDFSSYIGASEGNTPEQSEWNLSELIKLKATNIKAINFDVSIIKKLESEIAKNGYGIQFIPREIASYADFYLVKI